MASSLICAICCWRVITVDLPACFFAFSCLRASRVRPYLYEEYAIAAIATIDKMNVIFSFIYLIR